ncbi:hypothetical protein [Spiroplasma sp. SV19]|uniref:hypothetical protein n=1 Tax=Spiroplasma sp. SV19 TaxID=2570468 RepID=UPI0024B84BF6|nr:hypothetical protein [Spiroplasma sp. SV19]WHQ37081.1 hypothetical protein E7Y35_04185 [Spiroplasma sp. SV19]
MFDLFYIDQSYWGSDWKTFRNDLFNIDRDSFAYIYAYLFEVISDNDIKVLNDNINIDFQLSENELNKNKLQFLIDQLSIKFSSEVDFKEIENINTISKKTI